MCSFIPNKLKPGHGFSYIRSLNYFISDFIIKIFTKRFLSDNNILKEETEFCIWKRGKVSDLLTDKKIKKKRDKNNNKLSWRIENDVVHIYILQRDREKNKKQNNISSTSRQKPDQTKPGKRFFTKINELSREQYLYGELYCFSSCFALTLTWLGGGKKKTRTRDLKFAWIISLSSS